MGIADIYFTVKKWAILDWIIAAVFLGVGIYIEHVPFSDDFVAYVNSDINNPKRTDTVPYSRLCIFTFGIGALLTLFIWVLHRRDYTISAILSSYFFSISFTVFVSSTLKHLVGRPRPDTMQVCGGDGSYLQCSTVLSGIDLYEQFYSFPSGHAAESMAAAIFITNLITEIWPSGSMFAAMLKLSPIIWALFIGASRIWDRCHHVDDVIAGFLLGGIIGFFSFRTFKIGVAVEQKKGGAAPTDTSASQFSAYV